MRIIKSIYGIAMLAALGFAGANSARAAIILSEDFETVSGGGSVTLGANYTTTTSNMFKTTVIAGSGNSLTYTDDTTTGITFTGSNFLRYDDTATTAQPALRSQFTSAPFSLPALTGAWTVSFDFYEPNTSIAGTGTHFRLVMGNGDLTSGTTRAVDFLLDAANDGIATTGNARNFNGLPALVPYTTNALHHFDFVGNHSGATINYDGGTIADQTFDVYMDGVKIFDDLIYETSMSSINNIGFGYNSGSGSRFQRLYLDNIVVHDITAVPEPSTFAIAGIVLFGLGFVGAQQRSKTERNS
jgi:hypothetical protein